MMDLDTGLLTNIVTGAVAALGGGGVASLYSKWSDYRLSNRDADRKERDSLWKRLETRLSVLEAKEEECQKRNFQMVEEIGVLKGQIRQLNESEIVAEITCDNKGVIVDWSDNAERLFGFTADEMVGNKPDKIIPKHLVAEHHKWLGAAAEAQVPRTIDFRPMFAMHSSGHQIYIDISVQSYMAHDEMFFRAEIRKRRSMR